MYEEMKPSESPHLLHLLCEDARRFNHNLYISASVIFSVSHNIMTPYHYNDALIIGGSQKRPFLHASVQRQRSGLRDGRSGQIRDPITVVTYVDSTPGR